MEVKRKLDSVNVCIKPQRHGKSEACAEINDNEDA